MKSCPHCGSQYTDDTLQFCLQDGSRLNFAGSAGQAETPTVVLNETETVVRSDERVRPEANGTDHVTGDNSVVTRVQPARSRGRVPLVVGGIGVVLVVLTVIAALGGYWLYDRLGNQGRTTTSNNSNMLNLNSARSTPVLATPSVTASTRSSPSVTPVSTPSPQVQPPPSIDDAQTRAEVIRRVYGWKTSLEARDFNGYMDNYADSIDYFKRRGVSIAAVRADKARAFQKFDSMRVTISNEAASAAADGSSVTVTFDKEWHFSGRTTSDGKTRSQLEFSRISGRWLITAERDLQLYYKR